VIRRAEPSDVEAIATLFRRSFGTLTFLPTLHTPDEDRWFFGAVLAEHEVWVDERGGRVLGFAALQGDELSHLYVDPGEQQRGVGGGLLTHVKGRRPGGFRFWVFQRNENARRFYEAHGCVLLETTDGADNEEREPDALYEWRPSA
jgi:ribosomal protein S18 acetylase RimI-like enzyme